MVEITRKLNITLILMELNRSERYYNQELNIINETDVYYLQIDFASLSKVRLSFRYKLMYTFSKIGTSWGIRF